MKKILLFCVFGVFAIFLSSCAADEADYSEQVEIVLAIYEPFREVERTLFGFGDSWLQEEIVIINDGHYRQFAHDELNSVQDLKDFAGAVFTARFVENTINSMFFERENPFFLDYNGDLYILEAAWPRLWIWDTSYVFIENVRDESFDAIVSLDEWFRENALRYEGFNSNKINFVLTENGWRIDDFFGQYR